MIPKIIHSMWLGNKPQPDNYIEAWKSLNPDYEYIHWTDDNIWSLSHELISYAKSVSDQTMRSDLMRLVLLDLYGGVYTDVDIKPYYSIPPEFLHYESIVPYEGELVYGNWICNCFIMAEPKSKFIRLIIDKILSIDLNKFIDLSIKYEAHQLTGPTLFNYIFRRNPNCNLICLPGLYVDPEDIRSAYTTRIIFIKEVIKRRSLGYMHDRPVIVKAKGDHHIRDVDKKIKELLFNEVIDETDEESEFSYLVKD